jgi:hypothetical protein
METVLNGHRKSARSGVTVMYYTGNGHVTIVAVGNWKMAAAFISVL